ncbi:MAG: LLM class flavin-dependent oxidoreductase [Candidatus Heimdallarchaeota archaeon]|nr:LLM class flavin-dependent oxidoreductase [Candidatus Heimdallarchaeota archaeon]
MTSVDDLLEKTPMGMYLQDKHPIRDGIRYAQLAEKMGFDQIWQAESRLARESTIPLAAIATVTDKIKLGTGVASMWTRNVALMGATFNTLNELAPGRVLAGLGAWWEPLASKVGVKRVKPLKAMREIVLNLQKLLAMENVTFDGEFVQFDGIELDIVHGERKPLPVPVYIGATGPKMLELSGEIADGVLLNYLVSPHYNKNAMKLLQNGLDKSGRKMEDLDRPQLVVVSVDEDADKAINRAKELVTQYLGQQPHIGKASGVSQDLLDEVGKILTWPATPEDIKKAMEVVPDDVVQLVAAAGTAEDCRSKVAEYIRDGATAPIMYPLADDPTEMIKAFAKYE